MKLIKCDHCGRPFYDKEKACPYCGHAFDSLPPVETEDIEQKTDSTIDTPALSESRSLFTPRAQSIAAITEANSQISNNNDQLDTDLNQIETTYPPRRRHTLLWITIILLLLAAIAAAAYLFRDQLDILFNCDGKR